MSAVKRALQRMLEEQRAKGPQPQAPSTATPQQIYVPQSSQLILPPSMQQDTPTQPVPQYDPNNPRILESHNLLAKPIANKRAMVMFYDKSKRRGLGMEEDASRTADGSRIVEEEIEAKRRTEEVLRREMMRRLG